MDLLIFFSLALSTIVVAVLLNRLVKCPTLVGLTFFSVTLLIAAILGNTTLIVVSVLLGILAFLAAFLDCVILSSNFCRHNECLNCNNPYTANNTNNGTNNNNNNSDVLTIINNEGDVVGRINGTSVSCYNTGCDNPLLADLSDNNTSNSTSSCGCCNRRYR